MRTLATLNKKAAGYDLELVKGDGYFYWVHSELTDIPSVYACHYSHQTPAQWAEELVAALKHIALN